MTHRTLGVPAPEVLRARALLNRTLRAWFERHGFVEIDAPTLVRAPALEPELEALAVAGAWLHTSPEFALKRVLASGLGRIYALVPCYRGEEWGPLHATEFTMLEWYRVGCGYEGIMDDTRALLAACREAFGLALEPIQELTWTEAIERFSGAPPPADPMEAMRVWVNDVEQRLQAPTLIRDYPADQCAFAEVRGPVCERFELFWKGVELGNAFTELLDPAELRARFADSAAQRIEAGKVPYPVDERLLDAVGRHPRAGGIAVGVDRLLMALLGLGDIRDVRVQG